MAELELTIVIVNWNTKEIVIDCLKSIKNHLKEINYEIIVVDNNSKDKTVNEINRLYGDVETIALRENLGFGKANNIGINKAKGKYTLLLNPDTIILDNSIEKLVKILDEDEQIGIIAPKLLYEDGSYQSSVWKFPTIISSIKSNLNSLLKTLMQPLKLEKNIDNKKSQSSNMIIAEVVMGACMLLPTKILKKVEGFTEEYFMYGEDVDLCWKVKKEGYNVIYDPSKQIIHLGGKSSEQVSRFREEFANEAQLIFIKRNLGILNLYFYRTITIFFSLIKMAILSVYCIFNKRFRKDIVQEYYQCKVNILGKSSLIV